MNPKGKGGDKEGGALSRYAPAAHGETAVEQVAES